MLKKALWLLPLLSLESYAYPTDSIFKMFSETHFTIAVDHPDENKGWHCLANEDDGLKFQACQDPAYAVYSKAHLWQILPYLGASGGYVDLQLYNLKDGKYLSFGGTLVDRAEGFVPQKLVSEARLQFEDGDDYQWWVETTAPQIIYALYLVQPDPKDWKTWYNEYRCLDVDFNDKYGTYRAALKPVAQVDIKTSCPAFNVTKYLNPAP